MYQRQGHEGRVCVGNYYCILKPNEKALDSLISFLPLSWHIPSEHYKTPILWKTGKCSRTSQLTVGCWEKVSGHLSQRWNPNLIEQKGRTGVSPPICPAVSSSLGGCSSAQNWRPHSGVWSVQREWWQSCLGDHRLLQDSGAPQIHLTGGFTVGKEREREAREGGGVGEWELVSLGLSSGWAQSSPRTPPGQQVWTTAINPGLLSPPRLSLRLGFKSRFWQTKWQMLRNTKQNRSKELAGGSHASCWILVDNIINDWSQEPYGNYWSGNCTISSFLLTAHSTNIF